MKVLCKSIYYIIIFVILILKSFKMNQTFDNLLLINPILKYLSNKISKCNIKKIYVLSNEYFNYVLVINNKRSA